MHFKRKHISVEGTESTDLLTFFSLFPGTSCLLTVTTGSSTGAAEKSDTLSITTTLATKRLTRKASLYFLMSDQLWIHSKPF